MFLFYIFLVNMRAFVSEIYDKNFVFIKLQTWAKRSLSDDIKLWLLRTKYFFSSTDINVSFYF